MLPEESVLEIAPIAAGPRSALLRSIGWTTFDQALSSLTNFGITVFAARELSRRNFGAFGLALSLSVVVMGIARALATEPLLSRPDLAHGDRQQSAFRAVSAAALGLAIVPSVAFLILGTLAGGVVGRALIALALVLPGLCLQDAWRYCFLSQGRVHAAVVNDTFWLVTQVAIVVGLTLGGHPTTTTIILAWGCSGSAAAAFGAAQARLLPHGGAGWSWLSARRSLGGRYLLEFITSSASAQLALLGLGALAGLAALGAVRGAQAFFGPLVVLFNGVFLAVVPMAARSRTSPTALRRLMLAISAGMSIAALAWTLVGVALPEMVGRQLFGDTWISTREVLVPIGLTLIAGGGASGAIAGLRSLAAAREGLRARLLSLPILVAGPLAGAKLAGASGFAFGLAVATLASAILFWWQFVVAGGKAQALGRVSEDSSSR